jgi:hypothetical protein
LDSTAAWALRFGGILKMCAVVLRVGWDVVGWWREYGYGIGMCLCGLRYVRIYRSEEEKEDWVHRGILYGLKSIGLLDRHHELGPLEMGELWFRRDIQKKYSHAKPTRLNRRG